MGIGVEVLMMVNCDAPRCPYERRGHIKSVGIKACWQHFYKQGWTIKDGIVLCPDCSERAGR